MLVLSWLKAIESAVIRDVVMTCLFGVVEVVIRNVVLTCLCGVVEVCDQESCSDLFVGW
jgi:hypothetical protein